MGYDTARVPKLKQVFFMGGHTRSLRPKGLIHNAVEHREEMQSHGSRWPTIDSYAICSLRILEPMCIIDLESGFSNPLDGLAVYTNQVKASDIRFSSSQFRKQQ